MRVSPVSGRISPNPGHGAYPCRLAPGDILPVGCVSDVCGASGNILCAGASGDAGAPDPVSVVAGSPGHIFCVGVAGEPDPVCHIGPVSRIRHGFHVSGVSGVGSPAGHEVSGASRHTSHAGSISWCASGIQGGIHLPVSVRTVLIEIVHFRVLPPRKNVQSEYLYP